MSLLAVKLRRDLRASWSRMTLMTIAITVSLIVFGAILYAWAVVDRETASAYANTEPASATIVLDEPVPQEELAAIAAAALDQPGIISAAARTQFNSDIAINGEASNTSLQVFAAAPDDPMDLARFDIDGGTWPPAPDEIYLGGNSLDLLGAAIGDIITVETPSGAMVDLRVATTVYDPSLAPSQQDQVGRGYLSTAALGDQVALVQLKIQVVENGADAPTADRDTVVAAAGDLTAWLGAEYGLGIDEVQVPEPYAHPHQGQSDALLISLLSAGAAALLLSAILVSTMLNGLFARQIPQIGIMKAVGARSGSIGRFYATMTFLIAAAATVLATVPVALLGRAGSETVLGFLGIEAVSLTPPGWVWIVVVAAGLGLPPLLAAVPVIKASRTTVRQAIDHHGTGTGAGRTSQTMTRLGRLPFLDRGLLLALRNAMRRPARFALVTGVLACAGAVFVAGMSLSSGTEAIEKNAKDDRDWDVDVQLEGPAPLDDVAAVVAALDGVESVEGWSVTEGGVAGEDAVPVTRTYPDQGHGRISVIAGPPAAEMAPEPELLEGRWLEEGETGALVLNQNARDTTVEDAAVGDTVVLYVGGEPTEWTLVGVVQERMGGSGVYVTAEGLAKALGTPLQANQLRIATTTHDEASREEAAAAAAEALTEAGYTVISAESVGRADTVLTAHLGPIVTVLIAIAIVMGAVGGIGLASTMSANVLDRTRELGIMHAIGARPKAVRRVIVAEGVFLALASCALAALPAIVLTAILGSAIGDLFMGAPLPFRISWIAATTWPALVVLAAILATEAAASRASRITVREALAYI
jgi:putative ABC transport system permease protein